MKNLLYTIYYYDSVRSREGMIKYERFLIDTCNKRFKKKKLKKKGNSQVHKRETIFVFNPLMSLYRKFKKKSGSYLQICNRGR